MYIQKDTEPVEDFSGATGRGRDLFLSAPGILEWVTRSLNRSLLAFHTLGLTHTTSLITLTPPLSPPNNSLTNTPSTLYNETQRTDHFFLFFIDSFCFVA